MIKGDDLFSRGNIQQSESIFYDTDDISPYNLRELKQDIIVGIYDKKTKKFIDLDPRVGHITIKSVTSLHNESHEEEVQKEHLKMTKCTKETYFAGGVNAYEHKIYEDETLYCLAETSHTKAIIRGCPDCGTN